MQVCELAAKIDHAILKPNTPREELKKEIDSVRKLGVRSICVRPIDVRFAINHLKGDVPVGTVIGFPHGCNMARTKRYECMNVLQNGATELDVVAPIHAVVSENWAMVEDELKRTVDLVKTINESIILKLIFNTRLISEDAIKTLCNLADKTYWDYVKTSTGFDGCIASIEDIGTMKLHAKYTKIKASGGIKSLEQALSFIDAGADILGMSSTVNILRNCAEN